MNILHIAMGTPEFDRAAIDLGHQVKRIDWPKYVGKRYIAGYPEPLQREIMEASRNFKPDLVFVQTHQRDVISSTCYQALRSNGAFVVNWCGDVREPLPVCYERYARSVDVMAFSNYTDVELLRARGLRAEYLQIGFDPDIYHPGAMDRSGVVLIANHYAGRFPNSKLRHDVAMRLREEFLKDFTLYGDGWGIKGVTAAKPPDDARVYREALVAINVDHFTRPYFASDRILRATACGCAVVSMGYEGLSSEHPRVVSVATVDEMVDAVRLLLSRPDIAQGIGKENAENTKAEHRWHSRIKTMEQWILAR